jgi:hypothetical protein
LALISLAYCLIHANGSADESKHPTAFCLDALLLLLLLLLVL